MHLATSMAATAAAITLLWLPNPATAVSEFCNLDAVLHNDTFPATLGNTRFRICPDSFSAELLELEDGTLYGACFKDGGSSNIEAFRAVECRQRCREMGGDLPVVPSAIVQKYMETRFMYGLGWKARYLDGFWLGATDRLGEGNWTTLDGGHRLKYTNWDNGEPNNAQCGEHCALLLEHNAGKWIDGNCANRRPCLCQVPNATMAGAQLYVGAEPPFSHTGLALAVLLVTMALVVTVRVAAGYSWTARNRVGQAVDAEENGTRSGNAASNIESKADEERESFEQRLDTERMFPGFLDEVEEALYRKTVRDKGIEDLRVALVRTVPSIHLAIAIMEFVVIEPLNGIRGNQM